MTTRTAQCACGRVAITVEHEPLLVLTCHCDFCQKRSGNVFTTSAQFDEEQVVTIAGETQRFNGLETDGVGAVGLADGIDYHFCTTCGSTLYWDFVDPVTNRRRFVVAVGNFVDTEFPAPTAEFFTKFRHNWVSQVPGASQTYDPLDGSQPLESLLPSDQHDSDTG